MKKTSNYRFCPLCYCSKPRLYVPATSGPPTSYQQIQVTEKHFGLHGDIVRCGNCNHTYIGNKAYVDQVGKLYRKMSDEVYVQEEKERKRSFIGILLNIERLRKGKQLKILDIGCCTGGLLNEARQRGWAVSGIDPSVWACQTADKLHGLTIYNGTLESFKGEEDSFDAITLLDVLEHVENPRSILKKAYKLLKKDGILCIVTPDYGSLTAKILGKRWWGIRLAHLSYFREQDLSRLFQKTGFKIIRKNTYIRYFSLYYIFVRLLPIIDQIKVCKYLMKNITVPLVLFDTVELYLVKK